MTTKVRIETSFDLSRINQLLKFVFKICLVIGNMYLWFVSMFEKSSQYWLKKIQSINQLTYIKIFIVLLNTRFCLEECHPSRTTRRNKRIDWKRYLLPFVIWTSSVLNTFLFLDDKLTAIVFCSTCRIAELLNWLSLVIRKNFFDKIV